MKAADLDDADVLRAVELLCKFYDTWTNTTNVADQFPDAPFKVVAAKLSKLLKRGLVTGCACGCRGDWELTAKGYEYAGIPHPWRARRAEKNVLSDGNATT